MLVQLTISNFALIERLALELHPGFNVLTGETGAGKSILVDALSLVLGGRARPEMVRTGMREAEVEALFDVGADSDIGARLENAGIPCDHEVVIRRVVQSEGRSKATINGRMCTAGQLAEVAPGLCDIASQHESVSLTDPATHIGYLDAFSKLDTARDALAVQFDALSAIAKQVEEVRGLERGRAEREDFLTFQLREIDDLDPSLNEDEELEQERGRLRNAERLGEATRRAAERLYDGEGAICDELGRLASDLDAAAAFDASLAPFAHGLEAMRSELADRARGLGRYAESVESNPARLAEVEDRLFRLQKVLRRYGPTTADLLAQRTILARELEGFSRSDEQLEELESKRKQILADVTIAARALSKKRRDAAEKLADGIGRELAQLGMGRARVIVDVAPMPPGGEDSLRVEGARLTRTGVDRVEFLIAPNRGEDPRPLRKIASGGELSRALLALKRVLADQGPAGLYVFDEVDAGVGGAVAEVIGRSIAEIARHRQVLCITHLPQIAALADVQFVVGKSEAKGRTMSMIKRLEEKDRVAEIARMIGGVKVGDATKKAAAELLSTRR